MRTFYNTILIQVNMGTVLETYLATFSLKSIDLIQLLTDFYLLKGTLCWELLYIHVYTALSQSAVYVTSIPARMVVYVMTVAPPMGSDVSVLQDMLASCVRWSVSRPSIVLFSTKANIAFFLNMSYRVVWNCWYLIQLVCHRIFCRFVKIKQHETTTDVRF